MDYRCLRRLLKISYKDIITNNEVRNRVFMIIGNHKDLLTKVKERKLRWYGHIIRDDYSKNISSRYCKWHKKESSSETEMVRQHIRVNRTTFM